MSPRTKWLTRKEAADFLDTLGCPISPKRLATLVCQPGDYQGPPFVRSRGKVIRYHMDEVRTWALKRMERVE